MYDADGDGIAERYKILAAGPNGARQLLSMDPWPDDVPFVDLTPYPVPHRWMGRSLGRRSDGHSADQDCGLEGDAEQRLPDQSASDDTSWRMPLITRTRCFIRRSAG
jgi:hypothetical protein